MSLMLDDNNFSIKSSQKLRQSYRIALRRRNIELINRASANATAKLHHVPTRRGRDPGGPPPLSERGPHPPAHHGSTPSCFTPNATLAPQRTLRADAPFSLCRSPYPWLHPLLPLLTLARVKGWRTVCDGDLKEGDEGSDSATPTPTPTPPRRSLPLRTSDGRAVDRVHRARSLPTASVPAGARANSRAHRSEARTLEVSTVLRSSGSALGTLAPRNATPPHLALAPPTHARAPTAPAIQPPPCMEDSMIRRQTPDDDRGQPSPLCYSPLCGLRFAPLQGHDCLLISYPPLRGRLSSLRFERHPRARSSTWTPAEKYHFFFAAHHRLVIVPFRVCS